MGDKWCPIAREYNALSAGSLDSTDTEPHDRAVWRALHASYTPPDVDCQPDRTLFVGRLPHKVGKDRLHQMFSRFGVVEQVWLVRDLVTGASRGYGFVQFRRERDAAVAYVEAQGIEFEGCPALVDWEAGHKLKGWIPRRLGGGWGGRKEAGQLRFGCRDRPWRKPIILPPPTARTHKQAQDNRAAGQDALNPADSRNRSHHKHDRSDRDRSTRQHQLRTEKSYQRESSHEYGRSHERERRGRDRNDERSHERDRSNKERRHEREKSYEGEKGHERDRSSKGRKYNGEGGYEREKTYKKSYDRDRTNE